VVALLAGDPALAEGRDGWYDPLIRQAIAEAGGPYPVPLPLVKAVIRQESAFRVRAVSPAGARGLMQVMPVTARGVGVRPQDLFDPVQNIRAGVRLLSVLLAHYRGDVISTLVAYNARPRRLFAPVPQNGETPEYVWKVLTYYDWYSGRSRPPARWSRRGRRPRVAVVAAAEADRASVE
jgi:soluble lytic murein transglycosylase-like protein